MALYCDPADRKYLHGFALLARAQGRRHFRAGAGHARIGNQGREGASPGRVAAQRCAITGTTRDKEYAITKGTPDSQILYFSANPNGEAEVVRITLRPRPRLKSLIIDLDFVQLAIKGRDAQGNILTRYAIHKIVLKEKGVSTLGGQKVWYDETVNRLNAEGKGKLLGEFREGNRIIEITKSGFYRLSSFDFTTHFEYDVLLVEKFRANKVYSAVYYDGSHKSYFLKRFVFEATSNLTNFTAEEAGSKLVCISGRQHPRFEMKFGGAHKTRPVEIVNAYDFIAVKGVKAKGKRLTTFVVATISEIAPVIPDEEIVEKPENIEDTVNLNIEQDNETDTSQMTLEI